VYNVAFGYAELLFGDAGIASSGWVQRPQPRLNSTRAELMKTPEPMHR